MRIRYRVDHDGFKAGDERRVSDSEGARLEGETVAEIIERAEGRKKSRMEVPKEKADVE